jgi:glyceraldehyde-3-phosphate dehydrogenase [NAD(P)+]
MATTNETDQRRLYIGGRWETGDETIAVTDLAAGGTFERVAAADTEAVRHALGAAEETKRALRETTIVERAEWLADIAEGLAARREELVETVVREAGKPVASARSEVDSAVERFERAVEEARSIDGEYLEGTTEGHEGWQAIVKPEPMGAVLCISPYNYPLATTAMQVAPALAAGNSVLLKPSSKTPVSAAILAECVADSDVPDGAFNFVPGHGSEIGDLLAGDDRVNAIAMTGSSRAGERVARQSGLVQLHMELGGNAPAVVFPDADLDTVTGACAAGSLKYAGQRCSAVSRVLAHESVHDELRERFDAELDSWERGDLFEESTDVGPLISHDQAEWVAELVADAVDRGADLVRGGEREGRFYEPTLLADVPIDARILREEQFGPVVALTSFDTEEAAVNVANAGDLALDAAVFTSDYDRALAFSDRLDAGSVRINGAPSHGLGDLPFGGNKASGIGREGLGETVEAFLRYKTVVL